MLWEFGLVLMFVLAPQAAGFKAGRLDLGLKPDPGSFVRLADLLKVSSQNEGSGLEMVRRRPKRSVFLHSGVRICPQETINEVLASHQAYYQLRVCQEAVWEAFRIFFDRIPGTTEYQKWVHTCQHESLCISDLAQNFSSSEEHMSIITRESELPNQVPEGPVEQMLEFSIDLVDPGYRELLDDPDSPQYIDLAHHLQDQMQHVFVKLPGFKAIHVLGISPGGISVHYSLIFEITSPKISSEEAELATKSPEDRVIADLREMVTKALREEASLPIDLNSLNFEPEVIHLPALSATSTIEVVNEPDSHNEFEVSTVEPRWINPGWRSLSPHGEGKPLVTLLDPTAVPDDETTALTGGMAERNDNSPVSQDITEEEEAIYVGEPELSNEGLPIITHEIETIHHDEIGELVRDYIPTSPVILELETDAPYINLSPNLISEEDLTPVEEEGEDLDVVTPTSQVLFTTAAFAEEVTITTLSGITGQPPTEAMVNVEENEDVNALPGEEEAGLGVPETEDVSELQVEILEPEEEVAEVSETEEEEVVEVSEPEEEVVEVSEPEEEVAEVSETEEVAEVSETEEEAEVSETEEAVENQDEVAGSEPEESEPEAETSDGAVEILNEEHAEEEVEVLQPEKEIVELEGEGNEEPEEGISEVLNAVESEKTEPEVPEETEPEVPEETEPEVTEETEPEVPEETEPEVTEETEPEVTEETEPEVTEETEPEVTEETEPDVPEEIEPDVPEETEPEVTEETEPDVPEETEPEVPEETEPEVPEETEPEVPEETEPDVPEETEPGAPEETEPEVTEETEPEVQEETEPDVPEETEPEVEEETEPEVPEETEPEVPEETEPEVPEETELEAPEETEPEAPEETEPEVPEETEPEVPEETEPEVPEETELEVTEETEPEVTEETEPEVPEETELEVPEETELEVTEETEPEVTEETEPEVEVAEEEAVDVVKPVEEEEVPEVPEPEEEVVEISEVEEEEVVEPTAPAEVVVEVVEEDPETGKDSEEVAQPEEEVVEDEQPAEVGPEPQEEVVEDEQPAEVGPEPQEEVVEDEQPAEVGPEPQEEVVEDEQPAEVGLEPQEEVVVPPAEELPEVSEPASEEAVPELNPEEEIIELLEPEPEEDVTEPAAESIKILLPFDSVEDLNVGEDTVEIIEDNEFLPPIGLDQHLPHEEDNLPIVPADIQPSEEDEPVIDESYIEEDVDTSDIAEVTDQDNNDTSEGTEEDSISPESDVSVTETPVSDSFPSPPATEVSEPNPTSDSGLFEGAEPEPAVVIIDENLNPSVPEGIEIQTLPPATDDIIDEAEQTSPPTTARPPVKYLTTPSMTTASNGRELVVFFSLRVTNMDFSLDLFNKTSSEYRSLESTFLDVELGFFVDVVVNSKVKFSRSVPYNITEAVTCVLEEFCSDAMKHLHIQIDTHSLDVEP
ncbi:Interphotoreceptor matrix proteoglycan 1, partial [Dissostichus eleginoides]